MNDKRNAIEILSGNDFSLVLSGGGALGISHLGVIGDMERAHLTPREIVGTSMGGIIGACMSIGMREEEIYEQIKRFSGVGNWLHFSYGNNSLVSDRKISLIFDSIFGDMKISETKIALKIVATDLESGQKRVFDSRRDETPIRDALLATMAIPGIFQEKSMEGKVYVDGFICANLPVCESSYDTILAIDALGRNSFHRKPSGAFFKSARVAGMFERSIRLLILNQTRSSLQRCHGTIILVEPKTADFKTYHFHKPDSIRKCGMGLLETSHTIDYTTNEKE
jgi:NTE family protein